MPGTGRDFDQLGTYQKLRIAIRKGKGGNNMSWDLKLDDAI